MAGAALLPARPRRRLPQSAPGTPQPPPPGQRFFQATNSVAQELSDWFQDPALLSDWLVQQQQRMIIMQPLEVSPFASDGLFSAGSVGGKN